MRNKVHFHFNRHVIYQVKLTRKVAIGLSLYDIFSGMITSNLTIVTLYFLKSQSAKQNINAKLANSTCLCLFFLSIGYYMAKEHWFFLIYLLHIPMPHSYYLQLTINAKKLVASRKMKAFIQPSSLNILSYSQNYRAKLWLPHSKGRYFFFSQGRKGEISEYPVKYSQ